MICVEGIAKGFASTAAVQDVSFSVAVGDVVGLVAANGAGKTTTLRMIAGYLDPDRGRIFVDGYDTTDERSRACARLGYMSETVALCDELRVSEHLAYRARLKGVRKSDVGSRVESVMKQFQITDHRSRLCSRLSKGYRQRVALAEVLLGDPPAVVLDEPTAGLDAVAVDDFIGLLKTLAVDRAVLLSTHDLALVERVANRFVFMRSGRVVADGSAAQLRDVFSGQSLHDGFVSQLRGEEPGP